MRRLKKFLNNSFWVCVCGFFSLSQTLAAPTVLPADKAKQIQTGEITFQDVKDIIGHWIKFVLEISGAVALFMVVLGGFYMAMAPADSKSKGKTMLTYALMGLVVISMSWFIVDLFVQVITD